MTGAYFSALSADDNGDWAKVPSLLLDTRDVWNVAGTGGEANSWTAQPGSDTVGTLGNVPVASAVIEIDLNQLDIPKQKDMPVWRRTAN